MILHGNMHINTGSAVLALLRNLVIKKCKISVLLGLFVHLFVHFYNKITIGP